MLKRFLLSIAILFSVHSIKAQDLPDAFKLSDRIYDHINVLASDSLMGREAGTISEILAADYIMSQYREIGLEPFMSTGTYLDDFSFKALPLVQKETSLQIADIKFESGDAFSPLPKSGNGEVCNSMYDASYGIESEEHQMDDYKKKDYEGKIFLIDLALPGESREEKGKYSDFDLEYRIEKAIEKKASAIIFYNTGSRYEAPQTKMQRRAIPYDLPILFIRSDEILNALKQDQQVCINVSIDRPKNAGYNVVGFIDNQAAKTIIFGAHYDHLGFGGEGSRHKGEPEIHNGADDNASGVAEVIETARYLKEKGKKDFNYLFVAFSAEEKGLLGSAAFVDDPDFKKIDPYCMINFDMVGRLSCETRKLNITGAGSAKEWEELITKSNFELPDTFSIKLGESAIGGSDHTSFYLKNIPVLFFFSGLHTDYHMPSDDTDKINFYMQSELLWLVIKLINNLDADEGLTFQKTKAPQNARKRSYNKGVTFGLMPDHTHDGAGMKIAGVIEGKPAAISGLKDGDIIVKINDQNISDIYGYMGALGKLQAGDKVKVQVKRGKEQLDYNIQL